MIRVPVDPELLRWARERADIAQEDLAMRFKKLPDWESGEIQPTLKQLEAFARAVHVPFGYLFLSEPPEEAVPIPDFRTLAGHTIRRPSPSLLDAIYICQERQSWYRDFAHIAGESDLGFVGSASVDASPEAVATQMRKTLGFDLAARRECPTWTDALRVFVHQADAAGILIMVSGIVMSNSHRQLSPAEFRAVRPARAADLRQRQGQEGGADVHTRSRTCSHLAWRHGLVEPRGASQAGLSERGSMVQCGGGRVSDAAGCHAIRFMTRRAAPGRSLPAGARLQGQHVGRPASFARYGLADSGAL